MTIGQLVVTMGMNLNPLSAGVKGAGAMFDSLQKKASALQGFAGGMWGKLAAFAGVGAFGAMTMQAMESVDATGKMAAALDMPVEQLVRLRHAAEMAGVQAGDMDSAMTRFSRRMAFGAQGSGAAMGTIKKLKLDAAQLASMDPAEAFRKVSDEINKLPTQAEKMAAAFQLFGNSGKDMLDLISQGSEGIGEKMAEADGLGKVFGQKDVDQVAAANDAIDYMKGSISGLFNQVAIASAPTIGAIANGFTAVMPTVQWFFGIVKDFALDSFAVLGWAMENWRGMAEYAWVSAQLGVVQFGASVVHFFTGVLPSLFSWFTSNWGNIWFSARDLVMTVFINIGKNIRGVMSAIWDFIASGGTKPLEFTWTRLTDGFRSTVSQLPDIPERAVSQLEAQLQADANRIGTGLGTTLGDTMASAWEERNAMPDPVKDRGSMESMAGTSAKSGTGTSGPAAARVDSTEAYKLITSARASQETARDAYAKKQLNATQAQTGILRQIASNTGDGDVEEVDY